LKDEDETHVPTEQQAPQTDARIPRPDEHAGRSASAQAPAGERPKAAHRLDSGETAALSPPASVRSERFPPRYRLRKRREFLALQREGRRQNVPHFIVITRPTESATARLGITTSRKVGAAPVRNRIRRLVREVFRRRRAALDPPVDVLVIARAAADRLTYRDVDRELCRVLRLRAHDE
jgi:ribonuclease P protein component